MAYTDTFNRVMLGDYAQATEQERELAVAELIQVGSIASAAVAIQPFPVLDLVLLAPIQIAMTQAIGRVHGYELDKKSAIEILSTLGATLGTRGILFSMAKLLPPFGLLISVPMAYALTHSLGEVMHQYFKNGRGISACQLKAMFGRLYERRRAEHASRTASIKDKLADLVEARQAGLISEEEFATRKQQILDSIVG